MEVEQDRLRTRLSFGIKPVARIVKQSRTLLNKPLLVQRSFMELFSIRRQVSYYYNWAVIVEQMAEQSSLIQEDQV